jgi:hypothetical protein
LPTTPDRAGTRRLGVVALAAVAVTVAAPAAAAAPARPVHPVVLVAVPDLRWSDLAAMPHLSALATHAAVGELSVRSEAEATRCGDALLELSAGTRVPGGVTSCDVPPATLTQLRARYRHSRYGARIGLLGDSIGVPTAAVGAAAATVLSSSSVPAVTAASVADGLRFADVVVTVDTTLYGAHDRLPAARDVDARLAAMLSAIGPDVTVIVAGVSDAPTGGPRLHPVVVGGADWPHRELISASTGRAPYVQLFDLTATILSLEGTPDPPRTVSGRAVRASNAAVRDTSTYADIDRHARRALGIGHPTFTGLSIALMVVLLVLLLRPELAGWPARLVVFAPLATWLCQLLPWWRMSLAVYIAFVAGVGVLGALATWAVGRRSPRGALLLGPAVTAGVLLADQLAGAPLQISAPLGDNPLVAGRFHGMGNVDFGVTMAAAILCLAAVAHGRGRRSAVLAVGAGGALLVVIDGAPSLGDDIGGVLALVPALALLAALVARVRLTPRRVVPALAAAVAVAAGLSLLDYARPEDRRTHAGRFVEEVLNGDAARTLHRKLDAVLSSFVNPAVTALVVLAVVVVLAARRRPSVAGSSGAVVAATGAVSALAVVGSLLNDSGVFVAAAVVIAFAPAVVAARSSQRDVGDTRSL